MVKEPSIQNSDGWWRHFSIIVAHWIRTIQTLSEMPAECCNKWLVKTVLISGKSKWYWQQSSGALYGEKIDFNGTHLWTGHYRHSKLKSILVGMVENWLFSCVLRMAHLDRSDKNTLF
jgi:hypothetical protein